jgi:hypothetical protein
VSLTVWLILVASGTASGCHHHSRSDTVVSSASQDSLAGVVSVTGTSYEQHLVLIDSEGTRGLATSRDDSSALMRLGGADVVVYGADHADRFAVTAFIVRAIGGAAVVDGVLVRDGSRFVLRTRTDKLALGNAPAEFDSLVGARLWIGGQLDSGPYVYGLITPPKR